MHLAGKMAAADKDPTCGGSSLLKRVAEPREMANVILFLAADEVS